MKVVQVRRLQLLAACFGTLLAACDSSELRGQLVLTFQTDMAMPKQIDTVDVRVMLRGNRVQYMNSYAVGPGNDEYRVPGTLTLLAGEDPNLPITVRIAGSKDNRWRTYREITTTVPSDRVAELRMPIQWLCNESAMPQPVSEPDGMGGTITRIVSQCDDGTTCKAGRCVPNTVDSGTLPDYDPGNTFGGAGSPENGVCFDTIACLSGGAAVVPDDDCTVSKPDGERINLGLRVADGGICDSENTTCFVPLDGRSDEGWLPAPDGTRLQLPAAVCDRIAERKLLAVYSSTDCATKSESMPPCGEWSSVPGERAIEPSEQAAPWPRAQLVANLVKRGEVVCCPLLRASDKLYTCGCPAAAAASGTLYELAPGSTSASAFAIDGRPNWASAVHMGTFYWAADRRIDFMAIAPSAARASYMAPGGLYADGLLLADAQGVYVQTSGVDTSSDDQTSVKLVSIGYDGGTRQDGLGNRVVRQFSQDDGAFYVAVNRDQLVPRGMPFERASSVVRIDKSSHTFTTVLEEQKLTIVDQTYHGYLGVVSDGSTLFASFATAADSSGRLRLRILRLPDAASASSTDPAPLYELEVPASPRTTTLRLLGAADGALVFARDEYDSEPVRVRSASVLVIPEGSTVVRYVADFVSDSPAPGFASDADSVYWLNNSGALFSLARSAHRALVGLGGVHGRRHLRTRRHPRLRPQRHTSLQRQVRVEQRVHGPELPRIESPVVRQLRHPNPRLQQQHRALVGLGRVQRPRRLPAERRARLRQRRLASVRL